MEIESTKLTIIAPEWSEHRSDRCLRNVWSCQACGYQFENTVYFSAPQIQPEFTGTYCATNNCLLSLRPGRREAALVSPRIFLVLPEILKPIRCHFSIANCVHDVLVAHVMLESSGVMAIVGELVASGVPEACGGELGMEALRLRRFGRSFSGNLASSRAHHAR